MNETPCGESVHLVHLAMQAERSARQRRQRALLVLSGEPDWCRSGAAAMVQALNPAVLLWIGEHPMPGVECAGVGSARRVLGGELDALVFDALDGFDPDAFGACAGALRAGGLLLLCTPPLDEWPAYDDPENRRVTVAPTPTAALTGRYLARLVRVIRGSDFALCISPNGPFPKIEATSAAGSDQGHDGQAGALGACLSADQARAVEAIVHAARGHRKRPCVLVSDRGRGKSSALGIAAAQLLRESARSIALTGPWFAAVEPAMIRCSALLPGAGSERSRLTFNGGSMQFLSPDELVHTRQSFDLVLVDEAAAIPVPVLKDLLERHSRIVFSTTVHGYEGSGRGFHVRFGQVLNNLRPNWRQVRLDTPVRWAADDPLERFVFRALLLDAAPADADVLRDCRVAACRLRRLDRDQLALQDELLDRLYGLLVLAHYRTSPMDLRHLLDGPNLRVYVLEFNGQIAATALTADEGGLAPELEDGIFLGKRRVQGHLLPQSLVQHLGLDGVASRTGRRVVRIAVHPGVQGRGLGTHLLARLRERALNEGLDYLGTSFAAEQRLVGFWRRNAYRPVRVGLSRDTAGGAHAVLMLSPLSDAGHALYRTARTRFQRNFPAMLADTLGELEPCIAAELIRAEPGEVVPARLTRGDWRDVLAFGCGHRVYETCPAPLQQLAWQALADERAAPVLAARDTILLTAKVLQHRSWKDVAELTGLSGKPDAVRALRAVFRRLLARYADPATQQQMRAFTDPQSG